MLKYLIIISFLIIFPSSNIKAKSLIERTRGKILLQVEENGQAWYVNPTDLKRYYLKKPKDAFNIMNYFGQGITDKDLEQIPIGTLKGKDTDQDGLTDDLENALNTNPLNPDTDQDGYQDGKEIANNFDPKSKNKLNINLAFSKLSAGRIYLQTENKGQAWYINPTNLKRYYLGRPKDAFKIMKELGLGISNTNLKKIIVHSMHIPIKTKTPNPESTQTITKTLNQTTPHITSQRTNSGRSIQTTLQNAANALRSKNTSTITQYFHPNQEKAILHTINFLEPENRLIFANLLSAVEYSHVSSNTTYYTTDVWFRFSNSKTKYTVGLTQLENKDWVISSL